MLRGGVDEKSGEFLTATVLAERTGWCMDLVSGMTAGLPAGHFNTTDAGVPAAGLDAGGRALPSNAWMALRRPGWNTTVPDGVRVNDRIVRMAQEQAGRVPRSVKWRSRAVVTAGITTSRTDRSKTGPTRPRTTGPAPGRRRAPSPARPRVGGRRSRTPCPTRDR